ncbi:uncharacterized protein LOC111712571 [Eurytemora carolleeae]|uniref:uncharacterized protein LOC111712571 n=1 Tax=Eurytemora carolleeae TaxID=1294199 RepID=UPI000C7687B8|nr:uncharacterized protein LOC111712571 [Eurytemora carolleeae]|eukprot:XP_023342991.1 uncharacterized protein LOC111712571 [Eurytemora affinis]
MYDSVVRKILNECKCEPTFASGINQSFPGGTWLESCRGNGLICQKDWTGRWGYDSMGLHKTLNTITGEHTECTQACDYQTEQLLISQGLYPSKYSLSLRQNSFCNIVLKVRDEICANEFRRRSFEHENIGECAKYQRYPNLCKNTSTFETTELDQDILDAVAVYSKKNIASVKIFIGETYHTQLYRTKAITELQMLGNAGGLIGLCIGFSMISIIEVFYYFLTSITSLCNRNKMN